MGSLYVALLHGQVVNKIGEEISSSLTHFDLHDIARTCRSYGIERYFVVTPLETMRNLAQRMVSYWNAGLGAHTVPNRQDALEVVTVAVDLDEAIAWIVDREGQPPRLVCTSARRLGEAVPYETMARAIEDEERPSLVLFGTAYGLSRAVVDRCEAILPPIRAGVWNHLSVRTAVAITLDRLVGEEGKRQRP
jgi:hypothetical protein